MKKQIYLILAFLLLKSYSSVSQNVAITDDNAYSAHVSAMLDVKSTSKGLLIPRLTTAQRTTLGPTAATGLLVYDTNLNSFMYWNGSAWTNLTSGNASGIWSFNSPNVYLSNTNYRVGVGTTSPTGKMEVKSDSTLNANDPIFHVVNKTGDTIFAVYDGGVRINVYDDPAIKASGNKGGFAVGGFTPSKGTLTNEYLRVTPDSVRIYIEENPAAKGNNNKGGFAVGGFTPSKIGLTNEYLRVTNDSTRIWTEDPAKGFGVRNIGTTEKTSYMQLTPDNYFIGHESGKSIITTSGGLYNSFMGYQSGKNTSSGYRNVFLGYKSGFTNTTGYENIFLGYLTGFSNLSGYSNVFMGDSAGYKNSSGFNNILIGNLSGVNNTTGWQNIFIGNSSGYKNTNGFWNIFMGDKAGYSNTTGMLNVFIGNNSGEFNTTAQSNVFIGAYSGKTNTASNNTFLGSATGKDNTTGGANVFIGANSGSTNTTGQSNVYIGYNCGDSNWSGNYNVLMGREAGSGLTTGSNNLMMGYRSGVYNTTGNSNVFLGNYAGYSETGSNRLYIDNSSTTAPMIYGEFDNELIKINVNSFYCSGMYSSTTTNYPNLYVSSTGQVSRSTAVPVSGSYTAGTNTTGGDKTVTITYGTTFSAVPKVIVTPHGENTNDVFSVTTKNITTTSFQVTIWRDDVDGATWGQNLKIDWIAIP